MDILGGFDGLKTILGVSQPAAPATPAAQQVQVEDGGAFNTDRATLSTAGAEVSQTASEGVVREDKVAAIRAALESGTYNVPPSAVASRMVDAMLASA